MFLENRKVFLTGGSGGIGREIALTLAKEGAEIILFGGNNKAKLEATKNAILSIGGKCEYFSFNLTDDTALFENFEKAVAKTGGIDVLINNAGLAFNESVETTAIETLDKIMAINFRVPYILCQKSLPYLKKSNRASIINICSVVSHAGYENQSAYTASKHALLGFTKALASEVYKENIRTHAISPGGVFTDMIKISRPDLTGEGMIAPQEIADIVAFLLKNRGNAVIDEIIVHRVNKTPFLV